MRTKKYDSNIIKLAAKGANFNVKFDPFEKSPILDRDDVISRFYFHLSGGLGNRAIGYGGVGDLTIKSCMGWSSRGKWKAAYQNEWTLLRENGKNVEFIDYYEDCNNRTRLTAGTFSNPSKYPNKIPIGFASDLISSGYGEYTRLDCSKEPILHPLTEKDKRVLELRDYRYSNFSINDPNIIVVKIKQRLNRNNKTEEPTLNNLLFNEDVIQYLRLQL